MTNIKQETFYTVYFPMPGKYYVRITTTTVSDVEYLERVCQFAESIVKEYDENQISTT